MKQISRSNQQHGLNQTQTLSGIETFVYLLVLPLSYGVSTKPKPSQGLKRAGDIFFRLVVGKSQPNPNPLRD